ncbi:MAG: hypothetical protein L6R28_22410 [Planctomycetes bacterium]|nr:hypothetical protein [Planctomycetota bacterium]
MRSTILIAGILSLATTVQTAEPGSSPAAGTDGAGKKNGGPGIAGTALGRTAAAARGTPGKMVRFPEGDLPVNITDNIPKRHWSEWCDRFFFSDATGTAQTIAKGVSGEPMSHAEFVPTAGGGKGAWVQIGPDDLIAPKGDPSDPEDKIMPDGSEYGHPFETHCLDFATGDYYFGNYSKVYCYRNNYAERSRTPWSFRTSGNGTGNHFFDDGARGGLAFHPDLFGPGDGGLVATIQNKFFAWRKSTDKWIFPLALTGEPGKPPSVKTPQLLYIMSQKAVYGGGGESPLLKVVPGNPPTVTLLGSTPKGTDGKPLQIYGGHSYGPVRGSLLDDPEKKTFFLYQRSASATSKQPHLWKYQPPSGTAAEQWLDLGVHPFNPGPGEEPDRSYIAATVYGEGVFWIMRSTAPGGKLNSNLYCPPTAAENHQERGEMP